MSRAAAIPAKPPPAPIATAEAGAPAEVAFGRKLPTVVAAARKVFIEQGFRDASMDAIAREAGVSKATLYAYFPGKKALFAHLIVEECRKAETIDAVPDLSLGIAAALRSFAKRYVRLFTDRDPHRMAFFRTLVPEVTRFPELGQIMIDAGPRADAERLARLMAQARDHGLLSFADPIDAATQFLCLIRGELPIMSALGLPVPDDATVAKTIEDGLSLFLRACRPEQENIGFGIARDVDAREPSPEAAKRPAKRVKRSPGEARSTGQHEDLTDGKRQHR